MSKPRQKKIFQVHRKKFFDFFLTAQTCIELFVGGAGTFIGTGTGLGTGLENRTLDWFSISSYSPRSSALHIHSMARISSFIYFHSRTANQLGIAT